MKIITFENGSARKIDVETGPSYFLDTNIYIAPFSDEQTLVIDSWNDTIDLVSRDNIDPVSRICKIANRYFPRTNDPSGELFSISKRCEEEERMRGINVISLCPTFSCNLACTYCFERAFDLKEPMPNKEDYASMIKEAERFLQKAKKCYPDNPSVIELFGGEPLQRKTRSFVSNVLSLARTNKVGISIVTNGYDLISFLDLLVLYRDVLKSVSLTLDGIKPIHNATRLTRNGKGSFDKIVESVDAMVDLGLPIRICTNVSKSSLDALDRLIEFVINKQWPSSPYFQMEIGRVYDRFATNNNDIVFESAIQHKLMELFANGKPSWLISGFMKSTEYPSKLLGIDFGQNEYGKSRFRYCWATSNIIRGYYLGPDMQRYRCTTTVGNNHYRLSPGPGHIPLDTEAEWLDTAKKTKCTKCPIGGYCNGGCRIENRYKHRTEICNYELDNFRFFVSENAIPTVKKILAKGCEA